MIPRCCTLRRSCSSSFDDSNDKWKPELCDQHRKRQRRRPKWYTSDNDFVSTFENHTHHIHKVLSSRTAVFTFAVAALIIHFIPGNQFLGTPVYSYSTQSHGLARPPSISHQSVTLQNSNNYHWRTNGGPSFRERSTRRFVLTTPEAIIEQASTTQLLDDLIDESVRTSARRPLMMQFDPSSGWIWKRWKGTVFSETWDACVYRMIYACIVFLLCKSFPQTKELLSNLPAKASILIR